ncbi:MAG: type 4a pilus biogenesis protein PilO [Myxococcales bacterium]|nr:type 4a pilus biogenesis protein PilO [Myxococcales bacterium]MCB9646870.1 type 4a pilus biogenesis protein PilO [Deltaproteobacteria bacterium]
MDELIARISKVPFAQRVLVLAVVIVAIGLLNYVFFVSPAEDELTRLDGQVKTLDAQLVQKRAIAQNLARYRVEVERLKQRLNEALTLLPNEAEIPELLQKIAALVEQSDCQMDDFAPQGEVVSGFYARIPVKMSIVGNYHSIAVFFDKVSKLARIVNVTDIKLSKPKLQNKKVVLEAQFLATTFKFVERTVDAPSATGFGAK